MLRRFSREILACSLACTKRFYTPSEKIQEIYNSNFETLEFPIYIPPSDSVTYAKFLYVMGDKYSQFTEISDDLKKVFEARKTLPIFWERTLPIESIAEFKSLSPTVYFLLKWMSENDMLDLFPQVKDAFEAYINKEQKVLLVHIYIPEAKDSTFEEAKSLATGIIAENSSYSNYKITFETVIDSTISKGFAIEIDGKYINRAEGIVPDQKLGRSKDYLGLTLSPPNPTRFNNDIEKEVFSGFLADLAKYDMEEALYGV